MRRIRSRMLVASLLLTLLPAVPASLLVRSLLQRSLNPALQDVVSRGLAAGVEESRLVLRERKTSFVAAADAALARGADGDLIVLDGGGMPVPAATVMSGLLDAAPQLGDEPRQVGGYLAARRTRVDGSRVVVAQALPPEMAMRAASLSEAMRLTAAFRLDRRAILRSYVLPFLVVYALLALLALALAALLARSVVRPLETMALATARIAEGDFTTRVAERAPGEIGELARALNTMTARLEVQRRELARLEKVAAWRVMARTLAHEVKNPLTPILLAVQESRRSYRGDDTQHATVLADCETIVTEEVTSLRNLVRSFSDFARLPAPELNGVDVRALVDDLARLYGERLATDLPAGAITVVLDAAQIRRALVNLIDNGLAACRRAGRPERVTLGAHIASAMVVVTVHDAGDGITPENRARIFEPDFTTDREGLGLGLPIVDGIVAGHGGTIAVDSVPGAGTTFTVTVPQGRPDQTSSKETSCPAS